MKDYFRLTLDYVEGRIEPSVYEKMIDEDDTLYQWIQALVPKGKTLVRFDRAAIKSYERPYDIRDVLEEYSEIDQGGPKGSVSFHYHIHQQVTELFIKAFPQMDVVVDTKLAALRKLYLSACPGYIGGTEVAQSNVISNILEKIPTDLPATRQVRIAKEKIKEAFHVEGKIWPHWIQDPEWPMNEGKPMKYINTIRINKEHVQHIFVDVDTGDKRTVNDFF